MHTAGPGFDIINKKCPICDSSITDTTWMPFCSDRCRLIDFGKWMNENYSIRDADSNSTE